MKDLEDEANRLAAEGHRGQLGKDGLPYINHPYYVRDQFKAYEKYERIVAVLHDVVEDSKTVSMNMIYTIFGNEIGNAVRALTKTNNMPYESYIRNVRDNVLATKVKIKDLDHNMDLRRLNRKLTDEDMTRFNKYYSAKKYLEEALKKRSK